MRALIAAFLALVFIADGARAQERDAGATLVAQKYEADPQHSSVGFTARILRVVKVPGRFLDYSATIIYDPVRPERSSVTAIISAKSLHTDMSFRDAHLKSPDFLDTERYPLISFQSDSVRQQGGGLTVIGRLTLHGITRRLVLSVAVVLPPFINNPASGISTVAFETTQKLSRQDFAIAGSNKFNPDFDPATNLVADSFDVTLEIAAERQGYGNRRFSRGQPPSVGDTLLRTIEARGVEEGVHLYAALRATRPGAYNFDHNQLELLGHLLVERGRFRDAIKIFQLNAQTYPGEGSAFDALGEADCVVGDLSAARLAFRRAAQLDSTDTTPVEMLRRLRP